MVYPGLLFAGMATHAATGHEIALGLPLLVSYGLMPLPDFWIGEVDNNPPKSWCRSWRTTVTTVGSPGAPCHRISSPSSAAPGGFGTHALSWWAVLRLAYVAGTDSGLGINTGHELGHKHARIEQWLARLVPAVPAYGHFTAEHGRGHHRWVSTPEDHASARMGASIDRFALRELPGGIRRAWQLENARLAREGKSAWGVQNTMLQIYAVSALLQLSLIWVDGWVMPLFCGRAQRGGLVAADFSQRRGALRIAAPLRSPCLFVPSLPVTSPSRGPATAAQRSLRHVSARLCAAAVVHGDGAAAAGLAPCARRPEPCEHRSAAAR